MFVFIPLSNDIAILFLLFKYIVFFLVGFDYRNHVQKRGVELVLAFGLLAHELFVGLSISYCNFKNVQVIAKRLNAS